jgi:dynein heavy chain 2
MKSNVESRIKQFEQEMEKFAARWHQLKPGDDALDGDQEKCMQAVQSIKERKQEFDELDKTRETLM